MNQVARSFVVRIASLLFVSFCFLTIIRLQFKNNEIKAEINDMKEQIIAAENEREESSRLAEMPVDDAYVENVARKELGYRYPGELVFYNDN